MRGAELRYYIQAMWHGGATTKMIADASGKTRNSIGVTMYAMREDGWDLPFIHQRPSIDPYEYDRDLRLRLEEVEAEARGLKAALEHLKNVPVVP